MKRPKIIINFKTYKSGKDALKLAKTIEAVDKNIMIGVEASDVYEISNKTKLKIFVEHVDPCTPGRNTGYIVPEAMKREGAIGTFLNHSEHPLDFKTIKSTIEICKKIKLKTAVFVKDINEAKKIEKLHPDYLVYEPKELVAGDISVSSAKPGIIKKLSEQLKMDFLVGAGIKNSIDIKKSLELGAIGVALSSLITTSKDPKKALKELIKA